MADDNYSRGYRDDYGRGGAAGSASSPDPLTELARLIGQSDPFSANGQRQPDPRASAAQDHAPDWRGAPQEAPPYDNQAQYNDRYPAPAEQPQYADAGNGYGTADGYAAHPGGHPAAGEGAYDPAYADNRGYAPPQGYPQDRAPYYADQNGYPPQQGGQGGQGAHGGYDQSRGGSPGYGAPPYYGSDPHGRPGEEYDEAPSSRRRGWLVTVAAFAGLAVIGTAGAVAYRSVFAGGPAPIIARDIGPNKIVPANGMVDSGQSRPPERVAGMGGQNERLGPPPEAPMSIPSAPITAPAAPVAPVAPAGPQVVAPAAPAFPPAAPATPGGPRKIHTVKITSDQGQGGAETAPPPRAVAPPRTTAAAPTRNAGPAENAPLSLSPQAVTGAPATSTRTLALAAPAAAAPPAVDHHAGGNGKYFVQVSAQQSEEEAKSSFRGIQARYASLLGGQTPVFRRKDLGSKGIFYGAQVGPFSRDQANHLCESLRSAGGSCMVQRN